ncbi:transcription antitermination factor NusB [Paenalcaligenes suwonensis]|uniref:transcription antitermination factor NusB n=1 Tax=Paenalcaligenes suwonensis TaxID=1202713 RepID=UPI001409FE44|nr:transcription antitermination factor NusB [Paenalcaligenes suwonensis]
MKKTSSKRKKILTTTTNKAPGSNGRQNPTRSARRRSREFALQGIYAWLIRGVDGTREAGAIDAHIRGEEYFNDADAQWYHTLFYGVIQEAPELREQFMPHVDRPLEELSPIEHGILLLGSYELAHHVEVPYRVAINEAVELAKEFGGTDGFKFVNGVLDRVAAAVRPAEVKKYQNRS